MVSRGDDIDGGMHVALKLLRLEMHVLSKLSESDGYVRASPMVAMCCGLIGFSLVSDISANMSHNRIRSILSSTIPMLARVYLRLPALNMVECT